MKIQTELFGAERELPRWQTIEDPAERLAAFFSDGAIPATSRREADGVLRLHRKRAGDLQARAEARILEPVPLGLLMLVPAGEGSQRYVPNWLADWTYENKETGETFVQEW